jgi:hypothetical protein
MMWLVGGGGFKGGVRQLQVLKKLIRGGGRASRVERRNRGHRMFAENPTHKFQITPKPRNSGFKER